MKNSNQSLHVNTELCVDVKMYTIKNGRMQPGEILTGSFFRTDEDHFTFVEKASEGKGPRRPIVHVFCGDYVNVVEQPDGRLLLSFRKVGSKEQGLDFIKYCLSVIREISQIVRMTKF